VTLTLAGRSRRANTERVMGSAPTTPGRRVEVIAAPGSAPPFSPQAVIAEEDTFLVLSAAPDIEEPAVPRLRAIHEGLTAAPLSPGTVVVREGSPLRILAVVHDLSEDPTWRAEWVAAALEGVLRETGARGLRTLAMPPLGRVHGGLPPETFVLLLRAALARSASRHLERVWVITPESEVDELRALLASNLFC
jgi:hypothetical protein